MFLSHGVYYFSTRFLGICVNYKSSKNLVGKLTKKETKQLFFNRKLHKRKSNRVEKKVKSLSAYDNLGPCFHTFVASKPAVRCSWTMGILFAISCSKIVKGPIGAEVNLGLANIFGRQLVQSSNRNINLENVRKRMNTWFSLVLGSIRMHQIA